ncbi:MAG: galactokinase [Cytophagales bacterium]|nr:galactokinase [Cytophagales bacterium]
MNYSYFEQEFQKKYGRQPIIVRSPGRINIIGEHTDYNQGFVLPAAVDKEIVLAMAKNDSDTVRVTALDVGEEVEFRTDQADQVEEPWAKYIAGVLLQFQKLSLDIRGFDCVFGGTIPLGAGMSSSAALECGIGYGMARLFDHELDPLTLVKAAQRAENEFVGVKCGIMDQFANVFSKEGHVIKLDCRDLRYEYFPAELDTHTLVLFDTQVKHSLGSSEYNVRRKECEEGVEVIAKHYPNVTSLRDCTLEMLEKARTEMTGKVADRCEYVISEISRVEQACEALQVKALDELGRLMYETHDGLSQKYEVSCVELDVLVDLTRSMNAVAGARMMGGGFGGCTINLVDKTHRDTVISQVKSGYAEKFGNEPKVYEVSLAEGTGTAEEYALK